ncbi:hypothetical protein LV779_12660 [Streptomyces thinghirensis]|nr:hypothetical protein [Streptomyces thinghirensis]
MTAPSSSTRCPTPGRTARTVHRPQPAPRATRRLPWEVTDPARQNYFDAVERAWAPPLLYNGLHGRRLRSRHLARPAPQGDPKGANDDHLRPLIIASIVALGGAASTEQNAGLACPGEGMDPAGPLQPSAH